MVRVVGKSKKKRKERKEATGYFGKRKPREHLMKKWIYSYKHRKERARNSRRSWIGGLNIALRNEGVNYAEAVCIINKKKLALNRKVLHEMIKNGYFDFFKLLVKNEFNLD